MLIILLKVGLLRGGGSEHAPDRDGDVIVQTAQPQKNLKEIDNRLRDGSRLCLFRSWGAYFTSLPMLMPSFGSTNW